jgi:hypothetical protein
VDAWWRDNSARPNLFDEELAAAIALLIRFPWVGRVFEHVDGREIRFFGVEGSRADFRCGRSASSASPNRPRERPARISLPRCDAVRAA